MSFVMKTLKFALLGVGKNALVVANAAYKSLESGKLIKINYD